MSDERRSAATPPSQPPSSSGSSSSDPLLERLLGAITRALNGITTVLTEDRKAHRDHARRVEQRLADLHQAILDFMAYARSDSAAGTEAIDDARRALDRSRRTFERAVQESGSFPTHATGAVPAIPEETDEITGKHIKLRWSTIVKAWPWIWKIGTILAIAGGSVWAFVKQMAKLMPGWH